MNTCIKCGCDDAYPSLPPCPTPVDCPNPQPCAEFFDAQCVRYTLPDIMCGLNIVVAQDSSIAEALESIVLFFCTNFSNSVQSVTGLNTDNTDPLNPIVKVSVDGITITGLGTPASPLIAVAGGVDGSGTLNYLAKWTPDGNTLGNSLIRDDGTTVGINTAPVSTIQLQVLSSKTNAVVGITNKATGNNVGVYGEANGVGAGQNSGVRALASGGTVVNIGVYGEANGASVSGYGGSFYAINATSTNIGVIASAGGGTTAIGGQFSTSGAGSNYSLKLLDGSEGVGKVLTCMTATGEANWVTPSGGGVSGSGINNYVARWTPDGATLGTGLIRDNNTSVGIGAAPITIYRVNIETSTQLCGLVVKNTYSSAANTNYTGINGSAEGINTVGQNIGVAGYAAGNSNFNTGVSGAATSISNKNVGVFALALNGTSNYAIQLNDGTNALGRVLTCVGVQGEANWGKVTSTYTTGASGSFVVGAQTITVTNGLITSIV
jgi:hypothetical protein